MCGIAGAVSLRPDAVPDEARVRRMGDLVEHRGPDGSGFWHAPSGRALITHRRLAVIDLELGSQPMVAEDGRYGVVFNGEIYNYIELREELARAGTSLTTRSDTEVVLRLLRADGEEGLHRLRGMFAIAAWDDDKQTLLLARDRLGKKPLYWCVDDGCLYFSSTAASLLAMTRRERKLDPGSVDAFLSLGYVPAPETIYAGVHKLPAGSALSAGPRGVGPTTRRFWSLDAGEEYEGTRADALDELEALLRDAVRLRLRSDVPLGVFLSGGLDSSLVAALAAGVSHDPLRTFTIGFEVASLDERPRARAVARHLRTEHVELVGKTELLEVLPALISQVGEPIGDAATLPLWVLAKEARRHVTVALGGDGGDEGFAGYPWYRTTASLALVAGMLPHRWWSALADGRISWATPKLARALHLCGLSSDGRRFAALRSVVGNREARLLYQRDLAQWRQGAEATAVSMIANVFDDSEGDIIRRARLTDIQTYLADCLNPKVDVATMAHGLEARAPLLDHELISFALRLPREWLLRPARNKSILHDLATRYLPPSLLRGPKRGFVLPISQWFRDHRDRRLSRMDALLDWGWIQPAGIDVLLQEHRRGRRDNSIRLFHLLALDTFLRLDGHASS